MSPKRKLTMENHKDIGHVLKVAHECLVDASCTINNNMTNQKFGSRINKITKELDEIRSELDETLLNEFDNATPNIYYGERPQMNDIKKLPIN